MSQEKKGTTRSRFPRLRLLVKNFVLNDRCSNQQITNAAASTNTTGQHIMRLAQ